MLRKSILIVVGAIILLGQINCEKNKAKENSTNEALEIPTNVWIKKLSSEHIGQVYSLLVDPHNTNIVFACTQWSLAKVENFPDGSSKGSSVPISSKYQIAVSPTDRISDPALTFVYSIAAVPKRSKVLYACFAGIFKTDDYGQTWSQVYMVPPLHSILVNPVNPTILFAGGKNGILKSTDSGETWEEVFERRLFWCSLAMHPKDPSVIYAGSHIGLFKTIDGGASWKKMNNYSIRSVVIDPSNNSVIYLGTTKGVLKSLNSGGEWSVINEGLTETHVRTIVVDPSNSNILYIGTLGGGVFKSVDGGNSWNVLNNGLSDLNIYALAIDPQNPNIIWAGTQGEGIFRIVQNISYVSEASEEIIYESDQLTAFKARKVVDREINTKYGKADLIAVIGAEFNLREGSDKVIYSTTNKWLFIYRSDTHGVITASVGRDLRAMVVIETVGKTSSVGYRYIIVQEKANNISGEESIIEEIFDPLGRMRQQKKYPDIYSLDFSSKLVDWSKDLAKTPTIKSWKINSDDAMEIAIKHGGFLAAAGGLFGGGIFLLNMRNIDGTFAPMWLLPLNSEGHLIWGIRADTGEVVYVKTETGKDSAIWSTTKPTR